MPLYYFTRDGSTQEGPVELDALQRMAANGSLRRENLVWTEGMAEWRPAGEDPALFGPVVAPAAGVVGPMGPAAPAAGPPGSPRYAGFWIRFVAAFVDGILLGAVQFVGDSVLAMVAGVPHPWFGGQPSHSQQGVYIAISCFSSLTGLVIGWLYEAFLTSSSHQATVGKMLVRIRVVGADGGRISFARATGRHFAKILSGLILLIGYIMAAFTQRKQALHDMIASTYVVYR